MDAFWNYDLARMEFLPRAGDPLPEAAVLACPRAMVDDLGGAAELLPHLRARELVFYPRGLTPAVEAALRNPSVEDLFVMPDGHINAPVMLDMLRRAARPGLKRLELDLLAHFGCNSKMVASFVRWALRESRLETFVLQLYAPLLRTNVRAVPVVRDALRWRTNKCRVILKFLEHSSLSFNMQETAALVVRATRILANRAEDIILAEVASFLF